MSPKIIQSKSEAETIGLGKRLAKVFKAGDVVCLFGDLGTGKTTLIKGITDALKVKRNKVHSPTFTLLNIYDGKVPLYHFDLYRLDSLEQIAAIGYEEFLYGEGVAIIEWADKLKSYMPKEYLKIELEHVDDNVRQIKITGVGDQYASRVKVFNK